jgi:hypothetical protein
MSRSKGVLFCSGALLIGAVAAAPLGLADAAGATAAPLRRLPAPQNVSAQMQLEIKGRMARHDASMSNLVTAVVLLDRPTIRTLAGRIADEEIVARVGSAQRGSKQAALPSEFWKEQDALRAAAQALAVAALPGGEDKVLADRFAAVTRTCVACHSAYLHGQVDPPSLQAPPKPAPGHEP